MATRILLVDDHPVVRAGLRRILAAEADLRIVGEAGEGCSAVKMAKELKPDVVVMDVCMPEMNGIAATRLITDASSSVKVLCLSMHNEENVVDAVLHAGASGYILKDEAPKTLVEAVRTVARGDVYLSPVVTKKIIRNYAHGGEASAQGAHAALSARELEVLRLIAEGCCTKEIGARLEVSEKTVAVHREHIMQKLKLRNVVELTRYALRTGIARL